MILQEEASSSPLKFNFPKPKTPNLNKTVNKTMLVNSELFKSNDYKKQKIDIAETEFIDNLSFHSHDVNS